MFVGRAVPCLSPPPSPFPGTANAPAARSRFEILGPGAQQAFMRYGARSSVKFFYLRVWDGVRLGLEPGLPAKGCPRFR